MNSQTLLAEDRPTIKTHTQALLQTDLSQAELGSVPIPPMAEGEQLRHILLGTPGSVRQTIHLLHILRYAENALWSPLVPIPNEQLIITPQQGDVMSILVKHMPQA